MLSYQQLLQSNANNPEAVKALSVLTGMPEATLKQNYQSGGSIFADQLQNFARQTSEAVSGANGGSGEFSKLGEYAKWGGTPDPNAVQGVQNWQNKFNQAGVDFASSPYQTFANILKLPATLTPDQNGSRQTSANSGNFLQSVTGQEVPKSIALTTSQNQMYQNDYNRIAAQYPNDPTTALKVFKSANPNAPADFIPVQNSSNLLASKIDVNAGTGTTVSADSISKNPVNPSGIITANIGNASLDNVVISGLSGIDNALVTFFNKQQKIANTEKTALETKQKDLQAGFTTLSSTSSQDELNTALEKYQVQSKIDALTTIKTQIGQKQAALNLGLKVEEGRIAPLSIIGRRMQVLRDQTAGELAALSTTAAVLQDDLTMAKTLAEASFQALQTDKTRQLNAYEFLLNMNKQDIISLKDDEKTAINNGIATIKEAAKTAQDNHDKVVSLIFQNPTAAVSAGISLNDNWEDTQNKMLPYIAQQAEQEQAIKLSGIALDQQYKVAQIKNIQSEISNRGKNTGVDYDPASILAYAQQYGSTGQIPTGLPKGSFGLVAQVAKELPKQTGTLVNTMTGIKDSKIGTIAQDDISKLYNISKLSKQLADLDKKRVGGVVAGIIGKVTGSTAQSEYLSVRKSIVDEIQRMQSGAALTETEQEFYTDYLPGRFSESFFLGQSSDKKIQNFANIMNNKLQNSLKTNNLSIYGYSDIKIGDKTYKVGDIISNGQQAARVNPDGTLTLINQ